MGYDGAGVPTAPATPMSIDDKHEAKDLEIGPPFYLSQGVNDVIVFDPRTLLVLHVRQGAAERTVAPQRIELQCGCRVSI
jgi:hypothetical protein